LRNILADRNGADCSGGGTVRWMGIKVNLENRQQLWISATVVRAVRPRWHSLIVPIAQ
jgi:hypothetical protein